MEENNKVSIIIPAYNVEKYIKKCIESICNQTYRNIEIIIIDDGSTDNTAKIVDRYSHYDNRIKIIHKENKGVSAARNIGIEVSKGEYLVFVDADDYLASDYIEYMVSLAQRSNADFCLSKNCYTRKNEPQISTDEIQDLSPEEATALLLSPIVIVGCWNKILKKSFIDAHNLRFSTSLFYGEGLSFITQASQLASCVTAGNRKVYYYRRNNELSATTKFDINKLRNGEKALYMIKNDIVKSSPQVQAMWVLHMSMFSLGATTKICINKCKKQYKEDYKHWISYLRGNIIYLLKSKYVSRYRKTLLLGGCISPRILAKLDLIRRNRIANVSVE